MGSSNGRLTRGACHDRVQPGRLIVRKISGAKVLSRYSLWPMVLDAASHSGNSISIKLFLEAAPAAGSTLYLAFVPCPPPPIRYRLSLVAPTQAPRLLFTLITRSGTYRTSTFGT